jgi:uncharacterized protein YbjT (DUF2867 family)
MKVAVLGASGGMGRTLIDELLRRGHTARPGGQRDRRLVPHAPLIQPLAQRGVFGPSWSLGTPLLLVTMSLATVVRSSPP